MSTPSPLPPKPGDSKIPHGAVLPPSSPQGSKMPLPPKGLTPSATAPGVALPKSTSQASTTLVVPAKTDSSPSGSLDKTADLTITTKPASPMKLSTRQDVPAKPSSAPLQAAPTRTTPASAVRPAMQLDDLEPKRDYVELSLAVLLNLAAWGSSLYFYMHMPQ